MNFLVPPQKKPKTWERTKRKETHVGDDWLPVGACIGELVFVCTLAEDECVAAAALMLIFQGCDAQTGFIKTMSG